MFFCGATSEDNTLEVNHIIPISLIKKLNLDSKLITENYNLCTTCFSCNRGKKDYLTTIDINYYSDKIDKNSENYAIVKFLAIIKQLQDL